MTDNADVTRIMPDRIRRKIAILGKNPDSMIDSDATVIETCRTDVDITAQTEECIPLRHRKDTGDFTMMWRDDNPGRPQLLSSLLRNRRLWILVGLLVVLMTPFVLRYLLREMSPPTPAPQMSSTHPMKPAPPVPAQIPLIDTATPLCAVTALTNGETTQALHLYRSLLAKDPDNKAFHIAVGLLIRNAQP